MNRVLADDIQHVDADIYLMTHATNPLLLPKTVEQALKAFADARDTDAADSLFSVTPFQTRFYREGGEPINHDPIDLIRTQELPVWYEENSNLYLFTAASFSRTNARIGERPMMFVTPRGESVDIDDDETWALAEAIARGRE